MMKKMLIILLLLIPVVMQLEGQRYRLEELRDVANNGENELAPVVYDSGLVYLSNVLIPSPTRPVGPNGPTFDLYYIPLKEDGKWGDRRLFDTKFFTIGDEGAVTFAQKNTMLCIPMQNGYLGRGLPDNGNSGLYFSFRSNGSWGDLIPFEFNDPAMNYNTPFLTEDGMTLYFAADSLMEGSFGSWDIYVSRMENGKWTKPENLGSHINTPGMEFFPYFHYTGRLYFTSNGHNSRGGSMDLFFSKFYNGEWLEAIPVPSLNTTWDEFSISINEELSEGYFARKKSNGDFTLFRFSYPDYEEFLKQRRTLKKMLIIIK